MEVGANGEQHHLWKHNDTRTGEKCPPTFFPFSKIIWLLARSELFLCTGLQQRLRQQGVLKTGATRILLRDHLHLYHDHPGCYIQCYCRFWLEQDHQIWNVILAVCGNVTPPFDDPGAHCRLHQARLLWRQEETQPWRIPEQARGGGGKIIFRVHSIFPSKVIKEIQDTVEPPKEGDRKSVV